MAIASPSSAAALYLQNPQALAATAPRCAGYGAMGVNPIRTSRRAAQPPSRSCSPPSKPPDFREPLLRAAGSETSAGTARACVLHAQHRGALRARTTAPPEHGFIFNRFSGHADGEQRGARSNRRAASERPRWRRVYRYPHLGILRRSPSACSEI